jgi:hypothetical protein
MTALRLAAVPLFAAFIFAGATFAQTTAPAAPTVMPAPNCEKPGEPPPAQTNELGKAAAEMKRNKWQSESKAYFDCLKRFIDEQQQQTALHGKAANAAVDEYNKAIKAYNDYLDVLRQGQ